MRNKTNLKGNKKLSVAVWAALAMAGGATAHAITIETVPVGNVGNAPDSTGYGAVGYAYNIGKYEVTNAQYAAFLNAVAATDTYGLYSTDMDLFGGISRSGSSDSYSYVVKSGFENKPVHSVSFWDATRFANWLNNGQANANTETGSYTLTNDGISGNTVTRNVGANWVVTSENEWYKAAYYDPTKNSEAGGYWLYATQSDTPGRSNPFTDANGANYDGDSSNAALPVGTYANADSYYGTFDQGGNLEEWNEEIIFGSRRGVRGGGWNGDESYMLSSSRNYPDAALEFWSIGFRVASLAPIPEPSTYGAALGGVALAFGMMRRRKTRGVR